MKTAHIISLCLLITLSITSCSVEKRLYTKGYNIEWHKRHKQQSTNLTGIAEIPSEISQAGHREIESTRSENAEVHEEVINPASTPDVTDISPTDNPKLTEQQRQVEQNNSANQSIRLEQNAVKDSEQPKQDGLALASLILGILGLTILAIVLGLIQLHRIKKQPEVYSGKGMAIAGVLLGYGWIVFCSLFFMPFQIGVTAFLSISILFAIYGLIVLARNEKAETLGILGVILGWIGMMAATFLLLDY